MRTWMMVVSGLFGALGCSDDEVPASAEACVATGGAGCFVLPGGAVAAADGMGNPTTLTLGCAAFQVETSTTPITIQGTTQDFFANTPVGAMRLEAFSDRAMTNVLGDVTSDANGSVAVTINAMPSQLFGRTTVAGGLPTHIVGSRWNVSIAQHTDVVFLNATKPTVTTAIELVGDSFEAGHSQVATVVQDCSNNRLENVIGNISPVSGQQRFVDSVRTYYAITGTIPALGRRTQLSSTTTAGGVAFVNVAAGTYFLQAWAFLSEADVAKGKSGLTLIGETELIVPASETALLAPIFARH